MLQRAANVQLYIALEKFFIEFSQEGGLDQIMASELPANWFQYQYPQQEERQV